MIIRITLCLLVCTVYQAIAEVQIITEPRQGEEYVLVSADQQGPIRNFESSHKIPEKHPSHRNFRPEDDKSNKKIVNGKVGGKHTSEGIVSIEEDKRVVLRKVQKGKIAESIEIDIPVSKIEDIKIKENVKNEDINPKIKIELEAMSESGKLSDKSRTTTQKPILTTAPPAVKKTYDYIPINFDTIDDINSGLLSSNVKLEPAGSEQKQHSRIQIKKGPNGQDYEYEYIYYYYDEDDENKTSSSTAAPVHNSHDGPQKADAVNQIGKETKAKNKYSSIDRSGATTVATSDNQNEVLPASGRGRLRGRTIAPAPVEEEIEEDRLPSSTRFPPRGRNLTPASSTTYVPEVSSETTRQRGRPQIDNVADESIGQTRSRTRAHIRRPSSELVDLDSFKTNSGDIPSQYKEPPTRYSSESKTSTEIPEGVPTKDPSHAKDSVREGHSLPSGIRFQEIIDDSKLPSDYKQTTPYEQDTTEYTTMTAMEKVALDLYAYLAGENLNNDVNPTVDDLGFEGTTAAAADEESSTTEALSTTEEATTPTTTTTTTSTTTTTTTTTTPAPTTTAAPTRPSRFKGRPGARARVSTTSSAPTEPPHESSTRARGRFSKPGGVRKSTAAPVEASTPASAPLDKPVSQPKAFGRRGLFAGRNRPSSTTAAPASEDGSSSPASDTPAPRPRLRPNLRRPIVSTTSSAAPAEDSTAPAASESVETTVAPSRTIGRGRPGLRPASLRPGPRLNLRANPRPRPGAATEAPVDAPTETSAPDAPPTDSDAEGSSPTPAPEAPRGGLRVRNRLTVQPSPKPRVAPTPLPRRPNPLLKRKLPSTEATTEAAKKVEEEVTEESNVSGEKSEAETEAAPAETTPAPPLRGLDALFARRRAAGGIGARPARPARDARRTR
ncbi:mucin-5AC-like isoform X2 [Cydia strobilella]